MHLAADSICCSGPETGLKISWKEPIMILYVSYPGSCFDSLWYIGENVWSAWPSLPVFWTLSQTEVAVPALSGTLEYFYSIPGPSP